MKRTIFPITLILIAALFLSACGTAGTPVDETPGIPQTGETATVDTMPTEAATVDTMPTEAATTAATMAETEQATATTDTGVGSGTATPAADATTPAAGTATETTGGAGTTTETAPVPVTGETEEYVRLSSLMNGPVAASDDANAGIMTGVLVQHPVPPVEEEAAEADATPAASPTPAPTLTAEEMAFTVRYVLVDVTGGSGEQPGEGRIVVVPWQAFDFGTVQPGRATLNIDAAAISGAPHFSLPDIGSASGTWLSDVDDYWSGQDLTGFTAAEAENMTDANLSLISGDFRGVLISGAGGEDFGTVSDLLIDPDTGDVLYAVFSGGEALNNQVFVVPLTLLEWTPGTGTQLGGFTVNIPTETLEQSPIFQNLENLALDPDTIQQLQDFWQDVTPGTGE